MGAKRNEIIWWTWYDTREKIDEQLQPNTRENWKIGEGLKSAKFNLLLAKKFGNYWQNETAIWKEDVGE
jgi:hypothetical protein